MNFKLTEKGKKMFPNYVVRVPPTGRWAIYLLDPNSTYPDAMVYQLQLASGPREIAACISLGIIEEI